MNIKIGNGIGILKKKEQQTETIMTEEQDIKTDGAVETEKESAPARKRNTGARRNTARKNTEKNNAVKAEREEDSCKKHRETEQYKKKDFRKERGSRFCRK